MVSSLWEHVLIKVGRGNKGDCLIEQQPEIVLQYLGSRAHAADFLLISVVMLDFYYQYVFSQNKF